MDELIKDMRDKNLISFKHEDLMVRLILNGKPLDRISLGLACSKWFRLDKIDMMLIATQRLN